MPGMTPVALVESPLGLTPGVLALVVISWLVCAMVAASIADHKGLSAGNYFLAGLLLGIVGVLIAAVAQPRASAMPYPPAAPGWYPDPWRAAAQRYWDGAGWTGHVV